MLPLYYATDVYALGCVLFTALTGQVPFPRGERRGRLWAHLQAEPPRSLRARAEPAAGVDPVIERALAKRPEDRYPSAGDLARAASAALEGNPISQPEGPSPAGEAAPLEGSTVSATIPVLTASPLPHAVHAAPVRAGARRCAATAATAVAAASLLGPDDEGGAPGQERPPAGRAGAQARPTPELRVTRTARVGYRPSGVALAGGWIWVASFNPA